MKILVQYFYMGSIRILQGTLVGFELDDQWGWWSIEVREEGRMITDVIPFGSVLSIISLEEKP